MVAEEGIYFDDYDRLMLLEEGTARVVRVFDREIRSFAFAGADRLHVAFNDLLASYRLGPGGEMELLGEYPTLNGLTRLDTDGNGRAWGWSPRTPLLEIGASGTGGPGVKRHDWIAGHDLLASDHAFAMTKAGPVLIFHDELARYREETGSWERAAFDPGLGRPQAQVFRSGEEGHRGWLVYWDERTEMSLILEVAWPDAGALQWKILPWPEMEGIGGVMAIDHVDGPEPFLVIGGMQGLFMAPLSLSEEIPLPDQPVVWEGFDGIHRATDLELDHGAGSLRYSFSAPRASQHYPVHYQTRIAGMGDEWTPPSAFPFRDTGQLLNGRFQFQVRAMDPFGRTGPVASVQLMVRPPWYLTGWAILLYIGGAVLFVVGVLYGYELMQRSKRRRLERLVDERTRELRAANAFKDRLIANLSHEIRNPLNGVIGLIRLLKPDAPPPVRHFESLGHAADYLRNTVEGVLDFSKIQSGRIEVNPKPVDLRSVLMGPIGIYTLQAEQKGLRLKITFEVEEEQVVVTDEQKLQQIMGNLVSNAIKFTDHGSVSVTVRLLAGEGDHGTVLISVRDTGRGISAEEREHIFKEFYQGRSPGIKTPGTGLGLALVRQYVDRLDGRIEMDTTPGEGSCFTVTLPVLVAAFGSALQADDRLVQQLDFSVLVVEDSDYNRIFMKDFLEERGCRVELAADGDTGLRMALEGAHDIILLDWELPGLDGLEITRALRADTGFDQSTLLVGLTAFATADRREAGLSAGMDAFLTKPLDLRAFYGVLEAHFPGFTAQVPEAGGVEHSPEADGDELITSKGILGEMADPGEWDSLKARWLETFNGHLDEVAGVLEGGDTGAIRRMTHKLLGHMRMIRAEPVAGPVQEMLVAAHAGDMETIRDRWAAFNSLLPAFREAFDRL